ncbi:MAG: S-layer homology domain-containing protein [Candidatus Margulisiibacteriota bacterium]
MINNSFFTLILILFLTSFAQAVLPEANILPMRLESGSRPLSLGGAFAGWANDVNAAYYNPGGLPWAKGIAVTAKDFSNISGAQVYPTGTGATVGIAALISNYSGIPLSGNQEATYSEQLIVLSAGSKLANTLPPLANNIIAQNIGIGLNLKYLLGLSLSRTGLNDQSARRGLEADLGVLYKINRWLSVGVSGQNLIPGSTIFFDNGQAEGVPAVAKLGIGAKLFGDIKSPYYLEGQELLWLSDLEMINGRSPGARFGIEYVRENVLNLRLGYFASPRLGCPSLGIGYRQSDWAADLAYLVSDLLGSGSVSLSISYFPEEWVFERKEKKVYGEMKIADPLTGVYPDDNFTTYDDRIWVSGTAKPGVEVAVNNQTVKVDDNFKFSVAVPLKSGKNLVMVDSFYEGGKLAYERKILRRAKVKLAEERQVERAISTARTAADKERLLLEKAKIEERKVKVETLVTMGVVEVTPEAEFSLESSVTRGELVSWLVKAANYPLSRVTQDLYKDVPKEHPLAPLIKAAVDFGVMQGYADGTFRPNAQVTASEGRAIFKKFGVIK